MPGGAATGAPRVVVERLPGLDGLRPIDVAERFRDLPGLAVLESARPGRAGRWSFVTADPLAVVGASDGPDPFDAARAVLARLAAAPAPASDRAAGVAAEPGTAAPPFIGGLLGYVSYDLGRRLERLPTIALDDHGFPDLRLGLHDWVLAWDARDGSAWLGGRALDGDGHLLSDRLAAVRERLDRPVPATTAAGEVPVLRFSLDTDRSAFEDGVERVRAAIAAGELYQANLTRRMTAPFRGDPWPLARLLRTGEPAAFSAYLDAGGGRAIVSASPEPFLAVSAGGLVRSDPIKGTRPRGGSPGDDRRLAAELLASAKDRAENTMIVDVLRNDLGRVCRPGSVRVPRLCRLERTPSVQHLVSTVIGRLAPGRDALDLLAAAFPGGSITGAPKIRAMELVEELEPVRRGPYTGALGWLGPDGAMGTSILIRTFVVHGDRLTLHVGGGITWRSDPADEWAETVTKARGPLAALGADEGGR